MTSKTISYMVIPGVTTSIEAVVCKAYGITKDMLYERTRKHEISNARHLVIWIRLRGKLGKNISSTARSIGYHHATVEYAVKKINNVLSVDKEFRVFIEGILRELNIEIHF